MNAATTALLDQADAAVTQSLNAFRVFAEHINGTIGAAIPGPVAQHFLTQLHDGIHAGAIGFCHHLSPAAPEPTFWAPWAAGKVRCKTCMTYAYERVSRTTENHRCDRCRRRAITMHTTGVQLPAVVLDLPTRPLSLPPIAVTYGLCSTCHESDRTAV
ncbi:hypothetical protein ACWEU6_05140 [Streptosporangium sandarakinum]|uniref:hypothetical protein n=1 Tax=Streptosporangium sandarakinum TaxID=1260955 RepID=UPI00367C210C